jgi:hypothetical protein
LLFRSTIGDFRGALAAVKTKTTMRLVVALLYNLEWRLIERMKGMRKGMKLMMKNERPLSKLAYLFRFALDFIYLYSFCSFWTLSRLGVSVKLEVTEPKQKRTSLLAIK